MKGQINSVTPREDCSSVSVVEYPPQLFHRLGGSSLSTISSIEDLDTFGELLSTPIVDFP